MVNFKFLWNDGLAVSEGVLLNYFSGFKDPIRPQEVCRTSANPTHPIFQLLIWLWLYADRCVYCRAPFKRLSVEFFPPSPHSGDPQRCRIGRPGCCQHHLCHLSCSAAGCSACDKTWVYSGAENTGLNLAFGRSPSLSVSWQTTALVLRCHSVKAKAGRACL